jgi:hypothetical protein
MRRTAPILALVLPLVSGASAACSLLPDLESSSSDLAGDTCPDVGADFRFDDGTEGHADPLGGGGAHQARAGRIKNPADIVQPFDARSKIRLGDFVLANDKIAVYVEDVGTSDGYLPFGGEILGLEPVDAFGRPLGVSYYGESAILFGLQTVSPDRVSVLADGSDGGAAIVRVSGSLKTIPMLDAFSALFPDHYDFPAALDYVLEPGATRVTLRLSLANTRAKAIDFTDKLHTGFFQTSRAQTFTETFGFDQARGDLRFVAWDSGRTAFVARPVLGPMQVAIDISGLQIFTTPPFTIDACAKKTTDYLEFTIGKGGIDGALEARRTELAEPAWREIRGVVREDGGGSLGGAMVHATSDSGYVTRAEADDFGRFVMHVPPGAVSLTPTMKGWNVPTASPLATDASQVVLTLPARATLEVNATDAQTFEPLPVRVQIIPDSKAFRAPDSFGVKDEPDDRLYREYATDGHLVVPVPPGSHRVVVTRGYEYELYDAPVAVEAGGKSKVDVALKRSVDSTGIMCADFHIHSLYSADSSDPVAKKVVGAVADGLEIPVSSEHEYIIDFEDTIQRLGLGRWAFGMASEELTTFTYGHFGIVPLREQPDGVNHGAIDWVGKKPPELFPLIHQRSEDPLIIVNHPSDSAMGYFAMAGFDRDTTTANPDLWSEQFSAIEVFNSSDFEANRMTSVADWFALLNANKIRWAVGSSDSHEQSRVPVGYPRTCLPFGHDDPRRLTPEIVRDVVRAGTAVVSGGLSMTVAGPDGVLPGGTSAAGAYHVVVQSPGWLSASELEVIVDGVTTQTMPLVNTGPGPSKRYDVTVNVAPAQSRSRHWVVFHAKGDGDLAPLHPGKKPFAMSNPIFF